MSDASTEPAEPAGPGESGRTAEPDHADAGRAAEPAGTGPSLPLLVHRGDALHGVDQYARTVAAAVAGLDPRVRLGGPDDRVGGEAVHVHFTDRLWGADAEAAAHRLERLAQSGPVTVTLHDVPQESDGPRGFARRTDSYRRVVEVASGTVVNSAHELGLLERALGRPVTAHVIPLPAEPAAPRPEGWSGTDEVAVLGFFYPGKGHREVVDAVARLAERPRVVALGGASPGHERELAELERYAASVGVELSSAGFLPPDERLARMREIGVPVIAHQHVSASGSLTDWISAGRRPLTLASPYFREMQRMRPGTTTLVEAEGLAEGMSALLRHPSSTWLDAGTPVSPDITDTARAYLDWWGRS